MRMGRSPTRSYLCYSDAVVEHFKAVFQVSWDGQTHVDGHFLKTGVVDLFEGKQEVNLGSLVCSTGGADSEFVR